MRKIGILCAGDDELAPFLPHIKDHRISEKAMLQVHEGTIGGWATAALFSGVCKVNAAIATQTLIDVYQADAVINAGVAGGMDESLHIFDTVVCTQAVYHDLDAENLTDFHPWLPKAAFAADPVLLAAAQRALRGRAGVYFGRMATGEAFIEQTGRERIQAKYAPLSVDMETASVAHVCYVNQVPFLAIRAISDTAGHAGIENFEANCKQAAAIAKDAVLDVLAAL